MTSQSFVMLPTVQTVMRQPVAGILSFAGRQLGLDSIFYAFFRYVLLVFDGDGVTEMGKQLERLLWKGAKSGVILSFVEDFFQRAAICS